MNKHIKVSVVIPVYNRESLIADAVLSVLKQTYENFELIIVNDYSTDRTEEVIKGFQDNRIRLILNQRGKGAQGARNTGLYAAKGEWVAFLDSDDIWMPDKLEKQLRYLETLSSNVVAIASGYSVFRSSPDQVIKEYIAPKSNFSTLELLYNNHIGPFSTFIFRREIGLSIGGLDENFPAMQDIDFYISLSQLGEVVVLRDSMCFIRRGNNDRISVNYFKKLKAAEMLSSKYNYLIKDSFGQKANRYMRIWYYSIKSGARYNIRPIYILYMLFKDFKQIRSIITAYLDDSHSRSSRQFFQNVD